MEQRVARTSGVEVRGSALAASGNAVAGKNRRPQRRRSALPTTSIAGENETVETSETNETYFFNPMFFRVLRCGKKAKISTISKKCNFFEQFPILKLT